MLLNIFNVVVKNDKIDKIYFMKGISMINVVLCGGNGTRLWPISRTNLPKQFLKMFDNESLFQRVCKINSDYCDNILIVSNSEQYFIALDQYEEIKSYLKNQEMLPIIEPVGKNTAPAIAFSAFASKPDEILFVTPSDHYIKNDKEYKNMIKRGKELAEDGFLVTFGIEPKYPETGYGYIESNGEDVKKFHEKPDLQTAKEYLKKGNFLWNSGIFMFKAAVFLNELKKYAPKIYETSKKAFLNAEKNGLLRINTEDMLKIPEDSIDYAVLEKSRKIKVVKSKIEWNDVGNFDALDKFFEKDEYGNTKNENLIARNSKNNFVFGKYKTIALNEIENMIIVDTPTALLISKKGESQKIKEIVKLVKEKREDLVKFGRTVYRPWGKFTNLEEGERFKVKRLFVNPGKRLSLQKHLHRSEHWTVVQGTATVEIDDKKFLLRPNESTYIPIGSTHRLTNSGKIPVEVIEVQVGEYLGEDDIIRFEDDFGRA